ncbi:MAG: transposase [Acidimicrobiales bacterium]|nr:MAG: transposase [Acidimicrobiales bacterium]
MSEDVAWSVEAVMHMWARHQIRPDEATEAVQDSDAVWYDPDPHSKSGLSVRVIGYSTMRKEILVVILLRVSGAWEGVNGWTANSTHQRIYRQGL